MMRDKHKHKSGVITWLEGDMPVMQCPECGTENEWPWGDSSPFCMCHGGCGQWFKLDEVK